MKTYTSREEITDLLYSIITRIHRDGCELFYGDGHRAVAVDVEIKNRVDLLYISWQAEDRRSTHRSGLVIDLKNIESVAIDGGEVKIRGTFDCTWDECLTDHQVLSFIGEFRQVSVYSLAESEFVDELTKSKSNVCYR